jgi:hypothetical protein
MKGRCAAATLPRACDRPKGKARPEAPGWARQSGWLTVSRPSERACTLVFVVRHGLEGVLGSVGGEGQVLAVAADLQLGPLHGDVLGADAEEAADRDDDRIDGALGIAAKETVGSIEDVYVAAVARSLVRRASRARRRSGALACQRLGRVVSNAGSRSSITAQRGLWLVHT